MQRLLQMPLPLMDNAVIQMDRQLRRLRYDDALRWMHGWRTEWRVEWLYLARGYPQYRVYWRGVIVGIVEVPYLARLREKRLQLAMWLVGFGLRAESARYVLHGAMTRIDAPTRGVRRLVV